MYHAYLGTDSPRSLADHQGIKCCTRNGWAAWRIPPWGYAPKHNSKLHCPVATSPSKDFTRTPRGTMLTTSARELMDSWRC